MALGFYLGCSGSGKSAVLYRWVISESMLHPDRTYFILIPEQFSLQTQRRIVQSHPRGGILNIDVLSFSRLAWRIFEETGTDPKQVLTETGKNLILRSAASRKRQELRTLGGMLDRQGTITQIKSVLSEFAQYAVSPEQIRQLSDLCSSQPQLRDKLHDIAVLAEAFDKAKENRFVTGEELLLVFADAAPLSRLLDGATFVLDGFTGFTPVQITALRALFARARDVRVALTVDKKENLFGKIKEHELFYLTKKTIRELTKLAEETRMEVLEPYYAGRGEGECTLRFHPDSSLYQLERRLFRILPPDKVKGHAENKTPHSGEDSGLNGLQLYTASSPAQEAAFAAGMIRKLAASGRYRCSEIAVIAGDLPTYVNYLEREMELNGLPFFMDQKVEILQNPCLECIRAAMDLCEHPYAYAAVMRILRTGFTPLAQDEIDILENYLLAAGIRSSAAWHAPWERHAGTGRDEETLSMLNGFRERVALLFDPFLEKMKEKEGPAASYVQGLQEFLEDLSVEEQLLLQARTIRLQARSGSSAKAMEYEQIYGKIRQILDEIRLLLGEEPVTRKEFTKLLEAGFSEMRVGIIPQEMEQVYIGDVERTRLDHIKVLFFLGMNDGWIPARSSRAGILTEMERNLLESRGVELAPGIRKSSYLQRFYLYLCLTKPSEMLYVSYSLAGTDGNAMRPSYLVHQLKQMFPGLTEIPAQAELDSSFLMSSRDRKTRLAGMLREAVHQGEGSAALLELLRIVRSQPGGEEAAAALEKAALEAGSFSFLTGETSAALYGSSLAAGVSRMEIFAACAYRHFAGYGLKLKERERWEIRPADMGTVFHQTLERYSRVLSERNPDGWFTLSRPEQETLVRECLQDVSGEYGSGLFSDTARNRSALQRMERILVRTVWALTEQVRAGSFVPSGFEIRFPDGERQETDRPGKILSVGRIDRVDLCETQDEIQVKVIDYKSGSTRFDLTSLYHGLQLQLLVYLEEAMRQQEKLRPGKRPVAAGAFYCRLQDPVIEGEPSDLLPEREEILEERLLQELRPDGLVNVRDDVISHLAGKTPDPSRVIPVSYTAKGDISSRSRVATPGQLALLLDFVRDRVTQLGQSILKGEITPAPVRYQERSACTYCPYHVVCGFDKKVPGMRERVISKENEADLWNKIEAYENGKTVDNESAAGH